MRRRFSGIGPGAPDLLLVGCANEAKEAATAYGDKGFFETVDDLIIEDPRYWLRHIEKCFQKSPQQAFEEQLRLVSYRYEHGDIDFDTAMAAYDAILRRRPGGAC